MQVYAAFIWDAYCDWRVFVGIFDTEEKASKAADIAIQQAAQLRQDNQLTASLLELDRWSKDIQKMNLNEFNINDLSTLLY